MSRQEKKQILELDSTGIAIEDVYGSRKASPLFLCLSKAMIIFLVCVGTVTGFCDAFSLNYDKTTIVFFTLAASVLISLLYFHKKVFYIGYIAFLILFTVELLRYYLYANSGFQAITNHIREEYGEFFNMSVVRSAEESITNRKLTITIALIFIIAFLVIMYNITVSRYMNFAETFGISFILMQIPLYIGHKPPLFSVILIMTGCICTGLLQKGSFNRVTIPGKNAPDYIKDKLFKKTYYTTRGDHRGILMVLAISAVFSFFICIFSLPAYSRDIGETPEDSAKASLDDTIKILVQNGIYGLFNSYDSINGLNRGALGGVSAVSPDFRTDIVVSYVPYGKETIYLSGFKGVSYFGTNWNNRIDLKDYSELGLNINGRDYISSQEIDSIDHDITSNMLKVKDSVTGAMQIDYVDKSFGMDVYPYITYPSGIESGADPIYEPDDPAKERVVGTGKAVYYPIQYAQYLGADDYSNTNSTVVTLPKSSDRISTLSDGTYRKTVNRLYIDEMTDGIVMGSTADGSPYEKISYQDYIYDACLQVPDELDRYLDTFVREHSDFGLTGFFNHRMLTNELNEIRENGIAIELRTTEIEDRQVVYYDIEDAYDKVYALKDSINEYRLAACDAIKEMFLAEYPYTLSPGKTPRGEDYVRYFLESQKRGLCSHFASAGVMILRHMGIPARYIEGYCVPYSLVSEEADKTDIDGSDWFSGENEFNADKTVYSVPVSDYYAHAWVEIYLEGQGWVPYELTPPSFEAAPVGAEMSGIGRFFSQLLNVDLGFGAGDSDSSVSIADENTPIAIEEDETNKDLAIFVYPLLFIVGAVIIFWMLFLLIRKAVLEIRYSKYIKQGNFAPVVYARYNELVKKLKRKKIVTAANPLPMEVCNTLSAYLTNKVLEKSQTLNENQDSKEMYNKTFSENLPVFKYIEQVLYSDFRSNIEEYNKFYINLKTLM